MSDLAEYVVPIPALLPHQQPKAQHPARFKVLRMGRRWGKDRLAFNVSWFGHGPPQADGTRLWPGIVDGWDVAWLAPDFPQAKIIWHEEIEPRFAGIPGISMNATEHTVEIEGYGMLVLKSAENVTTIRGLGKRLAGVIINEAAHLDLAYAWRQVIRPVLMDNQGWALIMSTTNRGWDGGVDDQGQRRIPSYFNTLCQEVIDGKRGPEWVHFHGDARENPKIPSQEFQALVGEYPAESVALAEEVWAELMEPGSGLAFAEWRDAQHIIQPFAIPKHWRYGAGYDWGYFQPACLTVVAQDEDGQAVGVAERKWERTLGYDMGREIAKLAQHYPMEYVAADASIWGEPSRKGYANLAEEIQGGINEAWNAERAPVNLTAVPKGPESRVARAQLLHRWLKWEPEGVNEQGDTIPAVPPRLRFFQTCPYLCQSIPKLPPSPTNAEDVDTKADDHGYDALTYYLMTRPQPADRLVVDVPQDRHPGIPARYPGVRDAGVEAMLTTYRPRFKPRGRPRT